MAFIKKLGQTPFFNFSNGEAFTGHFTGSQVILKEGNSPLLEAVDQDGQLWLLPSHGLIVEAFEQFGTDSLLRITKHDKVKTKAGRTFQNYIIEVDNGE